MKRRVPIFFLAAALARCGGEASFFLAGAAQADITPRFEPYQDANGNLRYDQGEPFEDADGDGKIKTLWLGGFGPRQPTGVHDPLSARTVVFSAGGELFSLTALDALGASTGRMDAIRARAAELLGEHAFPTERMIIASTHTHQAPDSIGIFAPESLQKGWDPEYLDLLVVRAAESIRDARLRLRPARVRAAAAAAPELVRDTIPPEVREADLVALQFLGQDGEAIATLISISNHPEAAWNQNTLISADYPAVLREKIEERFGGLALFFAGALGLMQTPAEIAPAGFERVEAVGDAYARKAIAALENQAGKEITALRWKIGTATAPLEHLELRLAVEANIAEGYWPYLYQSEQEPCASAYGCFDLPLWVLVFGERITLLTAPGELVPELLRGGISRPPDSTGPFPDAPFEPVLADHLATPLVLPIGLCGAEIGYIYPKIEYDPAAYYSYSHSAGPSVGGAITGALCALLDGLR